MKFETELNPIPEPRYYTPSIEEFHVGFEYEEFHDRERYKLINDNLNKWNKKVYTGIGLHYGQQNQEKVWKAECFLDGEHKKDFRVKYLDREDIESLGWEPDFERAWCIKGSDRHMCFYIENDIAAMTYRIDKGLVTIRNKDQYSGVTLEAATYKIKNKSELKKLMQQLNITE